MFTDARISAAFESMVRGIDVPPVPMHGIAQKIAQRAARDPLRPLKLVAAMAAAIVLGTAAFPSASTAVVQSLQARYRAALQALGGTAPPPAPDRFVASLSSQRANLSTAQRRVRFRIVPPAGLPKDVVRLSIATGSTGVYSQATHAWQTGPADVTFSYRRADGRSMLFLAERFDPRSIAPKYMFEPKDDTTSPNGRPVLVRHEHFAWRNGDQTMAATEGAGMSAAEIEAVRRAMHGIPLPRRALHARASGPMKLYRIPKP